METYRVTLGSLQAIPRNMNSGLGLFLLLRGQMQLENGTEAKTLHEGDIAVVNHADIYAASATGPNVVLWIQLPFDYLDATCPEAVGKRFACCSAGADTATEAAYASLKHHVAQMAYMYYQKEAGFEFLFRSVLFQVLYELTRNFSEPGADNPEQPIADTGRIAPVLAYIHQNYKQRISLEEVAAREFMSVQYLSKLFRQKMGTTFSDYLNNLRLNGAVQDLVQTKDSATKIALNNGFASIKAMNQQFQRQHGCTPQEYRKNNPHVPPGAPLAQLLPAGSRGSLDELVRFIDSYERNAVGMAQVTHTVQLPKARPATLPGFKRIVNIGHISLALRADTRAQLSDAKRRIGVSHVYFHGFMDCVTPQNGSTSVFGTYDCYEAINLFCGLGLVPLIRLEAEALLAGDLQHNLEALSRLLVSQRQAQPPEFFALWQFELVGTPQQLAACFATVQAAIGAVHPSLGTGLRVQTECDADARQAWQNALAAHAATPPAFVSLALDPNTGAAPADAAAYEAYHQGYHAKHVALLLGWLQAAGLQGTALYLLDWNTLTGKSTVEAGEFHRTALVADVLAGLMGLITGFGMHLSLFSQTHNGGIITHSLSLYVYRSIRRPMFFVYKAFASLKPRVLFHRDNILLTEDAAGRYALLMYNPCYINPFHSLDNIRREVNERTLAITLQGLAPGRYRIKKFLMDKDNGSLYHSWVKLDFSIPLDEEDMDEYLENVSNPSVLLYEVAVEGSHTLHQQLAMNATALFIIKQIG